MAQAGCGMAQRVRHGSVRVRDGSDSSASRKAEFESRLGTPEEALYRAEAMRKTRAAFDE
jgi:hypothetical protein